MRISQVTTGQTASTLANGAARPLAMAPGQRLLVTVLANDDGLLQLLAEGVGDTARTLAARTDLPLAPGQRLPVTVAGSDGTQVILRLADGRGELAPLTPEAIVQSLALPLDKEWTAVISSLVRDSLPLTRELAEQVMTLWRRSKQPQPEAAALLWLARRGISPTPERVSLMRAFRHAHQGRGEPPIDAVMATVNVPGGDGPLEFSIWMVGIDEPVVEPDAQRQNSPNTGSEDRGESPADSGPTAGRPAVVLLAVATAHLGRVEALVEVAGETVDVTCFSDDAAAVSALTAEIDRLRTALAAAGLTPGALAARAPEGSGGEPQRLTRLDIRV